MTAARLFIEDRDTSNPIKMFNRHFPSPLCFPYRACHRNNTMTNWIGAARVTEESKMDFTKSTDNDAVHTHVYAIDSCSPRDTLLRRPL